jgi:hypothetical protein
MKKPHRRSGELDDADIGSLFNQQLLEPPRSVDVAILAAAQNAVEQQADFTEDELAGPSRKYTNWYQFAATAAMLVLAVTLLPILTQTPEYKRENSPAAVRHNIPAEAKAPASQPASRPDPQPVAQTVPQSEVQPASRLAPQPASAPARQVGEAAVQDSISADKASREKLAAPVSARRLRQVEARSEQKAELAAREAAKLSRAAAGEKVREAELIADSLDAVEKDVQGAASVMADSEASTAGEAGKATTVEAVRKAETTAKRLASAMKKSKVPVADHAPKLMPMRQAAPESQVDTDRAGSQTNAPITSSFSSGLSESEPIESKGNITNIQVDGDVILMDKESRLLIHAEEAFRQSPVKWTKEIIRLHDADDIGDAIREYVLFKKMYPELAHDPQFPKQLRKLAR